MQSVFPNHLRGRVPIQSLDDRSVSVALIGVSVKGDRLERGVRKVRARCRMIELWRVPMPWDRTPR